MSTKDQSAQSDRLASDLARRRDQHPEPKPEEAEDLVGLPAAERQRERFRSLVATAESSAVDQHRTEDSTPE